MAGLLSRLGPSRGGKELLCRDLYPLGPCILAQRAQLMAQPWFDVCFPEVWIAKYTKANPNNSPVPEGDFLSHPFPEPNPSDSWRGATSWQHLGNFGLKWKDETNPQKTQNLRHAPVDFDVSIYSDPGLGILSVPI